MQAYLRLLLYLAPYKMRLCLTWVLSLIVLGLQATSVWVGAGFIEKILLGQSPEADIETSNPMVMFLDRLAQTLLVRETAFGSLLTGVGILVGAALLTTAARWLKMSIFSYTTQEILRRIRYKMFVHLTHLDLSFSHVHRPGEIATLFFRDVDNLEMGLINAADRVMMQPLRLIMGVTLMAALSPSLTLFVLLSLIASALTIHVLGARIQRLAHRLMDETAELQGRLVEYLSGVVLSRSLGREGDECAKFNGSCDDLAQTTTEAKMASYIAPQIVSNLFVLSGGMLILLGGYRVLVTETLSGSVLLKMVLLLPVITYPLEALSSLYVSVRISLASTKRVFQFLDQERMPQDKDDAISPEPLSEGIVLDDLTLGYDDKVVIDRFSLRIPVGETVIISGPSGAGKSTILAVLAGFIRPQSGKIFLDDISLEDIRLVDWRKQIGIVSQEPILLNGSIRENLLYANPEATDDQLVQALREALLWTDKSLLKEGLDTPVGNRGELLSGGERQRVTIARALLNNPSVLLMDEPTAMLDSANRKKIIDTIQSVGRNRTVVIVTHDDGLRDLGQIHLFVNGTTVTSRT